MSSFRHAGLGRLWLRFYHTPLGRLRDSLRMGGPLAARRTECDRQAMEIAALTLPPLPEPDAGAPTLHLLTGKKFWYLTAFCLHSFARAAGRPVRAELYDDGSFDEAVTARLQRLGSAIVIHPRAMLDLRVEAALPPDRFPVLHERRRNYPNIRKLTDLHAGTAGWKLVIDSDLLFFRRPGFLLDWLAAPDRPLHAVDVEESYGYSRPLLERLAGAPIGDKVNVGLCGLRSDALDWTELEAWCAELIARERASYYLEQALGAMLAARQPCAIAPPADYVTLPSRAEVIAPHAVMHHYVADSKRWYFRHGWQHTI